MATWSGLAGWQSEPDRLRARLVIADKDRPLTALSKSHAGFKLVYEDHNAAVCVAQVRSSDTSLP